MPASFINVNIASAVGSSLFLEINPEPLCFAEVIGPGFSNKNNILLLYPHQKGQSPETPMLDELPSDLGQMLPTWSYEILAVRPAFP